MIPHPINQIRDSNAHREALIAEAIRERRVSRAIATPSRRAGVFRVAFPTPLLLPPVANSLNALKKLRLPRWSNRISTP